MENKVASSTVIYSGPEMFQKIKVHGILEKYFDSIISLEKNESIYDAHLKNPSDLIVFFVKSNSETKLLEIEKIRLEDTLCRIILVSCIPSSKNLVRAIKCGVSDCIMMPCTKNEFENSIIKVSKEVVKKHSKTITLGNYFSWNPIENTLFENKSKVKITKNEEKLLQLLCHRHDEVISHELVYEFFYGPGFTEENSKIRTLVYRLNKKLNYDIIQNVHGVGLRISK